MTLGSRRDETSRGNDMSDGEGSEVSTSENLPENENSVGTQQAERISNLGEDKDPWGFQRMRGLIDWSKLKVQQDVPESREVPRDPLLPVSKLKSLCSLTKETFQRYRALYFAHFHDRWPIIHSPTHEEEEDAPELLIPSILMIGGWIDDTANSRDWALKVHHHLVEHILPRLCQSNAIDIMKQSLPIVLYQCTLLNITFASYCGNREILTKGLILRNLLTTSIYEAEILTVGALYLDHKPGFFLPFHLVKQQQRQRIVVGLFKIDTYFSIIKGQPPSIKPEELHFSIPQTIALWNGDGLPIWEIRNPDEPKSRSQRSINAMFEDMTLGTIDFSENESMLEDIQICLWAMQPQISQLSKNSQPERRNELSLNIQRESLKRQLESLKRGLTKLSTKLLGPEVFEQADSPVRYYYGTEDHDNLEWQNIVSRRIHSFIFDTSTLYHLMNLQLFTETQTIRMLVKDLSLSSSSRDILGEVYSRRHAQNVSAAREWTQESNSRRALWHATEILLNHNELNMTPSLANFIPDPISHIALASAALIIWTFCMYGQDACTTPSSVPVPIPHEVGISIELTKISEVMNHSTFDEKGKEVWIERGAHFRASIENVQLCSCNVGVLMGKFKTYIPRYWDIVEEIAPNIFGRA